jgi:hypothetical protein
MHYNKKRGTIDILRDENGREAYRIPYDHSQVAGALVCGSGR